MLTRGRIAALLVGLVAAAACSGGAKQQVKVDAPTTSALATTTTSTSTSTTSTSVAVASDASGGATSTTEAPTTSTPDPCWMSTSRPDCGPLVWSPPNAPLVISVSYPDTAPVGTPFDIVVSMHDADDMPMDCGLIWGDDGYSRNAVVGGKQQCPDATDCVDYFTDSGTWPNPPGHGGDGTTTMTFPGSSKSGTYSFYVDVQTVHATCGFSYGQQIWPDPHGSFATAHITITFV